MKINVIILFALTFVGLQATAAGGGHGTEHIPLEVIKWQAINLVVLFGFLIWKLRGPVKTFFANKRNEFLQTAAKSQALRAQAEAELKSYEEQVQRLRTTASESVSRAEAESVRMKEEIVSEAHNEAQRILREAQETVVAENKKAERSLREQLVNEAVKQARAKLGSEMESHEHQKLQKSFVENMKVVNP